MVYFAVALVYAGVALVFCKVLVRIIEPHYRPGVSDYFIAAFIAVFWPVALIAGALALVARYTYL